MVYINIYIYTIYYIPRSVIFIRSWGLFLHPEAYTLGSTLSLSLCLSLPISSIINHFSFICHSPFDSFHIFQSLIFNQLERVFLFLPRLNYSWAFPYVSVLERTQIYFEAIFIVLPKSH